jgi:hypothetical protein
MAAHPHLSHDRPRLTVVVRLVLQELYEHLTDFLGLLAGGCMKTGRSYSFNLRLPDPVLAGTQD